MRPKGFSLVFEMALLPERCEMQCPRRVRGCGMLCWKIVRFVKILCFFIGVVLLCIMDCFVLTLVVNLVSLIVIFSFFLLCKSSLPWLYMLPSSQPPVRRTHPTSTMRLGKWAPSPHQLSFTQMYESSTGRRILRIMRTTSAFLFFPPRISATK